MDGVLTELNENQRRAARHRDGPLLVVAGAGAGKTRTIAYRILELIKHGVPATQILAVTFTNKAAREMLERVTTLGVSTARFPEPTNRPVIATFHTLGATILRENAGRLGLSRHFSIADQDDSLALIKTAVKDSGLDPARFDPRRILRTVSREKGNRVTLERYLESVTNDNFWSKIILEVWQKYEASLRRQNTLDFDDLLLWPVEFLESQPLVLADYRARWRYLLIDEYQDTNFIQYHLARLLAGPRRNICVVGDLDQAIYSWRGADCEHLLRFDQDYPGTQIITLEENYRSTKLILTAANQIISKNVNRREKTLFTNRQTGEKLGLIVAGDERQEADQVAERIAELLGRGAMIDQIAILYRANFQSRVIEEAMLRAGLPYRVLGIRFFERREVKDILAYLKAAINPADLESFRRIVNVPARGLGKVALTKILAGQENELPPNQRRQVRELRALLVKIRGAAGRLAISKTLNQIVTESGLAESLLTGEPDDRERLENIQELVSVAIRYDHLPPGEAVSTMLAEAALSSDQDTLDLEPKPAVNLMTAHAAKGLEFDRVFITGLEQGLFPHHWFEADESSDRDEEEERRLFYVALTRARDKLYLSYAKTRTIFGRLRQNQPSEFLLDLEPALFENLDYTSYAG
ncbi:MAG: UvrD-helicase domain-containing protein [Candidatus Vogelbacteria bacterium]|nr:UvrD-helicase domain-containing protein [Candidatus Vogelbacteria bacterium]